VEGAHISCFVGDRPAVAAAPHRVVGAPPSAGGAGPDADQLIEVLGERDPGDRVELTLVSSSGERSATVTLEQRPPVFES